MYGTSWPLTSIILIGVCYNAFRLQCFSLMCSRKTISRPRPRKLHQYAKVLRISLVKNSHHWNFYSFGRKLPWAYLILHYVNALIPKKTGKKAGPQRYRPDREAQEWSVEILEASDTEHQFQDQGKLKVTWLLGSKITSCYCCQNKFRRTPSDPVPPEPYDIVLCWKQIRAYTPKGSTRLSFTIKPEITYFHLKKSCVRNDFSQKSGLTASLSLRMTSAILSKSFSTN